MSTRVRLRHWKPAAVDIKHRCRWCGAKLGRWHHKECSPGQSGDGRVRDGDCMRLEYQLVNADPQIRFMHDQLRRQWEEESRDDSPALRSATVYIAGPMTGIPHHNFPAFHAEAARLRTLGCEVLSPAEKAGEQAAVEAQEHGLEFRETQTYKDFLKADLRMVLDSDAIQLLSGWEASRGAQLEVQVARAVGIEVWEPHVSAAKAV